MIREMNQGRVEVEVRDEGREGGGGESGREGGEEMRVGRVGRR